MVVLIRCFFESVNLLSSVINYTLRPHDKTYKTIYKKIANHCTKGSCKKYRLFVSRLALQ